MKTLHVDMTRYSGSDHFVTRLDRHMEGVLAIGDLVAVVDDGVDMEIFEVVGISADGRYAELIRA